MKSIVTLIFTFMMLQTYAQTVIQANHYITNQPTKIVLENGKIKKINQLVEDKLTSDLYVAPGLIDIQINGFVGIDFSGPDLTVDGVKETTRALWKAGVTSYFPTIISSDIDLIKKNFKVLAKARKDPEIAASIPGFHLEGPYISPVAGFRGAHLEKFIKLPEWEEFQEIQEAAEGGIILITVAPEIEGAIPFIRKCVESGVTVSLGHHNGTTEQIHMAVEAGARLVTHLGNGCANEINRHNNPIWPQLSEDSLTITIIADGFHLNREEVRSFYKVKGNERTILVSDALDLAGLEPGEYVRGERTLLLTPDVVKLPTENVLAGAASPISKCLNVMMDYTNCNLGEAIKMASTNPAQMFRLSEIGTLKEGKIADFILFKMEEGIIEIIQTYKEGQLVYSKI